MTGPNAKDSKDYATLFLARAILEGSLPMALAALDAGADVDAFWIDGATKLRDLPAYRGGAEDMQACFDRLPPSDPARRLPRYQPLRLKSQDNEFWSKELVLLAAARGYGFAASNDGAGGYPDPDLPPSLARKLAVDSIKRLWSRVWSVAVENCPTDDGRARSAWTLDFHPSLNATYGRRTRKTFWVDENGWTLMEESLASRPRKRRS